MKILFDIGHPAHVHYFKHLIQRLLESGDQVYVVAREKDITFNLLEAFGIPYTSRGKGSNNIVLKFVYLFKGAFKIWKMARQNKIDCFISFASPYNAIAARLYGKPNITFDDTEHNKFNHKIYVPLSSVVLTPESFRKSMGEKQIRFAGSMDSAYLHPKYFFGKNVEFPERRDTKHKKKIILRFVSWNASHDINQSGFTTEHKYKLIETLSKFADVYISSEKKVPADLEEYVMHIKTEDMHYYMKIADLVIGESGSMATEAAYLGTHSIVFNSASDELGVFGWFAQFNNFHIAGSFDETLSIAESILENQNAKSEAEDEAKLIQSKSLILTDYMLWFIKNYPQSFTTLRASPDYQNQFKGN
jgi:uncharacterized protein